MASVIFPASMPYDSVTVIDQSQYSDMQPIAPIDTVPSGPIMYCPFVSPRGYGKDRKLVYLDKARLAKYGTPNFDKYGLSLYLANRFADGGGTVLGYRVMPENASYANKLIYLKVYTTNEYADAPSNVFGTYMSYNSTTKIFSRDDSINYTTIYSSETTKIRITLNKLVTPDTQSVPPITDTPIIVYTEGNITISIAAYINDSDFSVTYKTYLGEVTEQPVDWTGWQDATLPIIFDANTVKLVINNAATADVELLAKTQTSIPMVTPKVANFSYANSTATKVNVDSYINETNLTSLVSAIENSGETGVTKDYIITTYDSTKNPFSSETPYYIPLFVIRSNSLGEFANAFKMTLTQDSVMNETAKDGFFYKFTDTENNAAVDNPMSFSLFDYIYSKSSMYIDDVFGDYASQVEPLTFKGAIDAYVKYLAAKLESTEDVVKVYDLIFGTGALSELYPNSDATERPTGDDYALIPGIEYQFAGGSDNGSTPLGGYKFEDNLANVVDSCLKDGYTTTSIDPNNNTSTTDGIGELLDQNRYPFEYIYAPTYNTGVVNAISDLCSKERRNITHARYFTAKCDTYDDARTWKTTNFTNIETYQEIIECEYYLIRDPYTYKNMYMPGVYFHAFYEPQHWLNSKSTPLAGRNYMITGFKTGSVVPASANPYEYIKNHNKGLNTVIEDGNGYAIPYEQITAQQGNNVTSALSEINNVYILDNMIRIALQIAQNYRWSLNVDPNAYGEAVQNAIADNLAGCYKSLEVISTQDTVNGAGRNRIYCRLNVVFNSILKGVTYEFYILLDQ